MEAERLERGRQRFREVMGWEFPAGQEPFSEQGVLGTVFAELWTRPGLADRDRRWISITCVCAAGSDAPIRQHIEAALDSGDITFDEMTEFVLHFAFYAGWPIASTAHRVLREIGAARYGRSVGSDGTASTTTGK
jgi:4-carboxymuconolactone decarboxylase